jgi:PhzF family phenazine biosynthesis protein
MKIQIFQVDAFTNKLFGGNPAAVCVLHTWLSEPVMQAIAEENNLAETAFILQENGRYHIRWFTPVIEVDLCGHATLAAAHVIFTYLHHSSDTIEFSSLRSGLLTVSRVDGLLTLNFPVDVFSKVETPLVLAEALGIEPMETYRGKTDYMVVLPSEKDVQQLTPDLQLLSVLEVRGIIVTAVGDKVDFVSRFFGPRSGINEDPVTGSSHTTLVPYWSKELDKQKLSALQLSARGGQLWCIMLGERVAISGHAVTYLKGEIEVG